MLVVIAQSCLYFKFALYLQNLKLTVGSLLESAKDKFIKNQFDKQRVLRSSWMI